MLALLSSTDSGPFASPRRAELLWALECLAWKYLGRVSFILAKLSRTVIDDNWVNKPTSSLQAIYRSWMPQTSASLEERMQALEALVKRFPDIGWQICIEQLNVGTLLGHDSQRPRWRSDASGAGQIVTRKEMAEFNRKALDLALAWSQHDQKTLRDLIERLSGLSEEDQVKVWGLIDAWADSDAAENAKADLREWIRRFAFTRRTRSRGINEATRDRARVAYEKLQSRDLIIRHSWLFAEHWVEASDDEIQDEEFDYSRHEEWAQRLRTSAIKEIWTERGFEGVMALLSHSNAPGTVGQFLGWCITDTNMRADFLRQCLSQRGDPKTTIDGCIAGFLLSVDEKERSTIFSTVAAGIADDQLVRLFLCAPFGQDTWRPT